MESFFPKPIAYSELLPARASSRLILEGDMLSAYGPNFRSSGHAATPSLIVGGSR
jgi:hypothetical protein